MTCLRGAFGHLLIARPHIERHHSGQNARLSPARFRLPRRMRHKYSWPLLAALERASRCALRVGVRMPLLRGPRRRCAAERSAYAVLGLILYSLSHRSKSSALVQRGSYGTQLSGLQCIRSRPAIRVMSAPLSRASGFETASNNLFHYRALERRSTHGSEASCRLEAVPFVRI